jgi:hypothetical protein
MTGVALNSDIQRKSLLVLVVLEVVVPGITSGRQLPAIGVIQLPI